MPLITGRASQWLADGIPITDASVLTSARDGRGSNFEQSTHFPVEVNVHWPPMNLSLPSI